MHTIQCNNTIQIKVSLFLKLVLIFVLLTNGGQDGSLAALLSPLFHTLFLVVDDELCMFCSTKKKQYRILYNCVLIMEQKWNNM